MNSIKLERTHEQHQTSENTKTASNEREHLNSINLERTHEQHQTKENI